jgi:hypothetical protein
MRWWQLLLLLSGSDSFSLPPAADSPTSPLSGGGDGGVRPAVARLFFCKMFVMCALSDLAHGEAAPTPQSITIVSVCTILPFFAVHPKKHMTKGFAVCLNTR